MPRSARFPAYPRKPHKSGQARVRVNGRDHYLGAHGSPESRDEYRRLLALWDRFGNAIPEDAGRTRPADLSVADLVARWAEARGAKLSPHEYRQYGYALGFLTDMFGGTAAAGFGPRALATVQAAMVKEWRHKVVNRQLIRVRTVFRWAEAEELVPRGTVHALGTVEPATVRTPGVLLSLPPYVPPFEDVRRVALESPAPVGALLLLQWWTGMRPAEACAMRAKDIEARPDGWAYRPGSDDPGGHGRHKNAWRGQDRAVPLGPKCRAILRLFGVAGADPEAYLFAPALARKGEGSRLRGWRRPAFELPRQSDRVGGRYTDNTYPQAVRRACLRAGVKPFDPYSLRHAAKMRISRAAGADAARAVLGQKTIEATQHYGEIDARHAAEAARRLA